MIYPLKTLDQLPLFLKGFRKSKKLTQAAMAERLGITQQSYAHFEANPNGSTMERLFLVLRLLDVEITLHQASLSVPSHTVEVSSKKLKSLKTTRKVSSAIKRERW